MNSIDYKKLNKVFPIFLKNIGKENQIPYAESIIICDSDKCIQYYDIWEKNGIPFDHGVIIYLITKMKPYSDEARKTISASEFVIKYYNDFKKFIPLEGEFK